MAHTPFNLADAEDLIAWANKHTSQSNLPRLIRRLVSASAKELRTLSFRAGSGVQFPGWDGTTIADDASTFVPKGITGWELSIRGDRRKVDEDYHKRTENPASLTPAESSYQVVTLRRWKHKDAWATARMAEAHWASVRVLDADDLATWLESCPAVHLWLSRELGKYTDDALDLDTYWSEWSTVTRPALTTDFLLAGREKATEAIHEHLRNRSDSFAIQAESPEEALAVFTAAVLVLPEIERDRYLSRTVVARNRAAWDQLTASEASLVLVPRFDNAEAISRALNRSHRVVSVVHWTEEATPTTVIVPRLSVRAATRALSTHGIEGDQAQELAVLARRSLLALRRRLAVRPEFQRPAWARPDTVRTIIPLLLAGGWNESNAADLTALRALHTGSDDPVDTARRWAREVDPPVRSIGDVWYVTSKEDVWILLSSGIAAADLERFESVVLQVLGELDPRYGLDLDTRWMSTLSPSYSPHLRRGLADTLAIMGARGATVQVAGQPIEQRATRIVRGLLESANSDWRIWASLETLLPTIVQAAPATFLDAVDAGLRQDQPILRLFQESTHGFFGSSPYTGLLFALELLSWSEEHLAHTALVLASLTRLDPGGTLSNRPRSSLSGTFFLLHPQTAAPWERQLQIFKTLLDREPRTGWQAHTDVLPSQGLVMVRPKPQWRDWAPATVPTLTVDEYRGRIRDVVMQMLSVVGIDGARWSDLIRALTKVPTEFHETIVERLEGINSAELPDPDRASVWSTLRELVSRHRSFSDAEWALPSKYVDRLEELYPRFEPTDLVSRYGWLFKNHVHLTLGGAEDREVKERAVAKARANAIHVICNQGGVPGVEQLRERIESSYQLGLALGLSELAEPDEDRILITHLASDNSKSASFANGFIVGRVVRRGREWVLRQFELPALSAYQRGALLMHLEQAPATWTLAEVNPEIEQAYWHQASTLMRGPADDVEHAARQLAKCGRAYAAVELLAFRLRDVPRPRAEVIADILDAATEQEEADVLSSTFVYHVGKLLDVLIASSEIERARIARIEWVFASVISHDRPLTVLHSELSADPGFFNQVLGMLFPRKGEEHREPTEADRARASSARDVLASWKSLPGTSPMGKIDTAALNEWVDGVFSIAKEQGLSELVPTYVGQALSHGPQGSDGVSPHEAVREVIERLANVDVESGFEIEIYNTRGFTTRSIDSGGEQEAELAERYAEAAEKIVDRWPRTGAMLRRVADWYRDDARREDVVADLRHDGLW